MNKIISLVEEAFRAKRSHGPNSQAFKTAQLAAIQEIDKICQFGQVQILAVENSDVLGSVKIRIEKKDLNQSSDNPVNYCSYLLFSQDYVE